MSKVPYASAIGSIMYAMSCTREILDRGDVKICKIPGESNVADPLTKQLARPRFESHVRSFGLRVMHDWD